MSSGTLMIESQFSCIASKIMKMLFSKMSSLQWRTCYIYYCMLFGGKNMKCFVTFCDFMKIADAFVSAWAMLFSMWVVFVIACFGFLLAWCAKIYGVQTDTILL